MSKKVYTLKRATGRMKIQHMRMVLDWRADLKEKQAETMTEGTRQWMIEEIKRLAPDFRAWYDKVYALRRDGKEKEYETAIRQKYEDIRSEIENAEILEWLAPSPADKRSNPVDYDTTDLPSPVIISGGEVLELSKTTNPDEEVPF